MTKPPIGVFNAGVAGEIVDELIGVGKIEARDHIDSAESALAFPGESIGDERQVVFPIEGWRSEHGGRLGAEDDVADVCAID